MLQGFARSLPAWVFYGLITTDATLLYAESDDNEEGPFPRLKSLLLAHWTSIHPKLEDRIKTLILHLAFFCNLTSLLACSRDENDASKVQIRIRVFLRSKYTAVTALVKLLPPSCGFLSGSWQRCEGGLSGHALYEECVQTKRAGANDWMAAGAGAGRPGARACGRAGVRVARARWAGGWVGERSIVARASGIEQRDMQRNSLSNHRTAKNSKNSFP